jgi:serine/threonine-protein kinase
MIACPTRPELSLYLAQDRSLGCERFEQIEVHVETCPSCQDLLDQLTADEIPVGMTLPDLASHGYRVYKLLGSGAFGEVWLAQDLNLPRVVAAKTLRLNADSRQRAAALEILRRDAHLLTDVDHPNVVRVYAWLTVHDHHYLVMQYIAGGSLADLIKSEGALDWQRAARYVADVGEGLLEVHARGIVHRDVKPSNILWEPRRDEALLTDFGVAARLSDPATVSGSIPYMAPEAFEGRVSPSLDVYGLAATFFHLVTGSVPFQETNLDELRQQIARGLPDSDPRCTGLPEPLERVIRAGLTPDASRRPGLKEFSATLRGELNRLLVGALTISGPPAGSLPATELGPGNLAQPPREPTTEREPPRAAPVDLRLIVNREVAPDRFEPVAATDPQQPADRLTRDMKKVPAPPGQVRLRTGDRVRIEVRLDRRGFVTVFNVGPIGTLNLLHPCDDRQHTSPPIAIEPHEPLHIVDVEMLPPAGRERLFAVWSLEPLPLRLEQLQSLVEENGKGSPASRPYVATRDMKRVQESVRRLRPESCHIVTVELDHVP